jgi:hypothetical protein
MDVEVSSQRKSRTKARLRNLDVALFLFGRRLQKCGDWDFELWE